MEFDSKRLFLSICLCATISVISEATFAVPVVIKTSIIKKKSMSFKRHFIGVLKPLHTSLIQARANGRVSEIYVSEGDRVKKGDLLLEIVATNEQLELDTAEANYNKAISDFKAEKFSYLRTKQLYQKKSISESQYRSEKAKYATYESGLKVAESNLKKAKLRKQHTKVKAPAAGIIYEKKVMLHSLVTMGTPLFVLSNINVIRAVVPVPNKYRRKMKKGMNVTLKNLSDGQKKDATLTSISPVSNHLNKSVNVYIDFNSNNTWYLGSSVQAGFDFGTKSVFYIPIQSIVYKRGNADVFVINAKKAAVCPVEVISIDKSYAWIKSNSLKEGMIIATEGAENLHNNATIRIQRNQKSK